jgi:hypothetical protein
MVVRSMLEDELYGMEEIFYGYDWEHTTSVTALLLGQITERNFSRITRSGNQACKQEPLNPECTCFEKMMVVPMRLTWLGSQTHKLL